MISAKTFRPTRLKGGNQGIILGESYESKSLSQSEHSIRQTVRCRNANYGAECFGTYHGNCALKI